MARKEEAELILKIKQTGSNVLSSIPKGFAAIGKAVAGGVVALGGFTLGVINFVRESEKFDQVKNAFTNLAAQQGKDANKMLANMRELSHGTVSDLKLMQQANQALLLGLPVERFGEMLTIARSASKATGESMDFMLNSIVTGLGRGSKLMLDNLGIVFKIEDANKEYAKALGKTVGELTEAEQKQAFMNKALAVGVENAKAAGETTESLDDRWQRFIATMENSKVVLGQQLSPALKILLDDLDKFTKNLLELSQTSDAVDVFKALTKGALFFKEVLAGIITFTASGYASLALILQNLFSFSFDNISSAVLAAKEQMAEDFNEVFESISGVNARVNEEFAKAQAKRVQDEAKAAATRSSARKKDLEELKGFEFLKSEAQKLSQQGRVKNLEDFLNLTQSLSNANSKVLAAIGKAAAITEIAIKTPEAVASSFAFGARIGGPPLGFAFGAIAATAMGAQAARIAGIQLADGGVVKASQGGTHAIIGEGGRDEAVVPLDRAGGLGGMTVNFYGPLMGDANQARLFAKELDAQFVKLRQNNESLAFDKGLI